MPSHEPSDAAADYRPLDLDAWRDAGLSILDHGDTPPLGEQTFHGLPFLIGTDAERCFVAPEAPVAVPVGDRTYTVLFLHRLLGSRLLENDPVGLAVAEYVFHYDDGAERVPIRERFEIAGQPKPGEFAAFGHEPFRARRDRQPALLRRDEAPNALAGFHQTGAHQPPPAGYYLYAWRNPHPERPLRAIEIVPLGPRFLIAAITLGQLDESPFPREPARPLILECDDDGEPAVTVDRGIASRPFQLPTPEADALPGFGEQAERGFGRSCVYVTATPSATLSVGDATVRWGDLQRDREVQRDGVRIRIAEDGRNWVRTRVVDDRTGEPIPCRVHFRSADGVPYQPHGHHGHVRTDLSTWHADIGGDVRLGQATYAYIDGTCEGWLPRGSVLVDVARGFEYEPLRTTVEIDPGRRELELRLRRIRDLRSERWFGGDSHVHFLSTQGASTEARGEDLAVVNLLLSQWGGLFTNTEEFTGMPSVSGDGQTIVYASQENRQHLLGHLTLLGLKRPVMPWCSDGLDEAELGGSLETTLSHWADRAHEQGGTVIIPHLPVPNGEPAALIATGRADAVEFLVQSAYFHREYYRYLNCGYRLPLVGGTDKMSAEVPVGLYRTYVHIPDEELSYDAWCRNLAAGRTFLSGGPLIGLTVEGAEIGDTVRVPNGGTVEVHAWAESIFPITRLEIVQEGRVVASTESAPTRRLELREQLRVDGHTWIAARTGAGPSYFESTPHHDTWNRRVMAHTSPVYVECGRDWDLFDPATAQYMLTLIDGSLTHIRESALLDAPGSAAHHHGLADHLGFLEQPFHEAAEAIHRRLHAHGVPH